MKKIDIKITNKIVPLLKWLAKHHAVIVIICVLGLYTWLVAYINILNRREPSEEVYAEKLQTIKKPTISKSVIDKLTELEDNNVEIKSLFREARDNPFKE